VLRETSKALHPIGVLSPVTAKAKIFMQQLWQKNIDWDELLTTVAEEEWLSFSRCYVYVLHTTVSTSKQFNTANTIVHFC